MKKRLHILISGAAMLAAALAGLLQVSCVADYLDNPATGGGDPYVEGQKATFSFTVTVPDAEQNLAITRAATPDTKIRNVSLLVFKHHYEGGLIERVEAENIQYVSHTAQGAAKYKFDAALTISAEPRDIAFLVNARDDAGNERTNIDQATSDFYANRVGGGLGHYLFYLPYSYLQTKTPATEAPTPMLMYGRLALPGGLAAHQTQAVNLIRCTAAIDVKVASGVSDFVVNRVSIQNASSYGHIPPHPVTDPSNPSVGYDWGQGTALNEILQSTILPDTAAPGYTVADHFTPSGGGYWSTPGTPHYLYESQMSTTFVILDATWKGTRYYYKLKLKPIGEDDGYFVRNHKYIVTVVSVSQPGFLTLEEAVVGHPSTDKTIVTYYSDKEELTSYIAKGHILLGTSCDKIKFFVGNSEGGLQCGRVKDISFFKFAVRSENSISPIVGHTLYFTNTIVAGRLLQSSVPGSQGLINMKGILTAPGGTNSLMTFIATGAGHSVKKTIPIEVHDLPGGVSSTPEPNWGRNQFLDVFPSTYLPSGAWWSVELLEGHWSRHDVAGRPNIAYADYMVNLALMLFDGSDNRVKTYLDGPRSYESASPYDVPTPPFYPGEFGLKKVTSDMMTRFAADKLRLCYYGGGAGFRGTVRVSYILDGKLTVEDWVMDGESTNTGTDVRP